MKSCSALRPKGKKEDLGTLMFMAFVFPSNLPEALLSSKWLDICLAKWSSGWITLSALVPHAAFVFLVIVPLFQPTIFSTLFSLCVLLRKGTEGATVGVWQPDKINPPHILLFFFFWVSFSILFVEMVKSLQEVCIVWMYSGILDLEV